MTGAKKPRHDSLQLPPDVVFRNSRGQSTERLTSHTGDEVLAPGQFLGRGGGVSTVKKKSPRESTKPRRVDLPKVPDHSLCTAFADIAEGLVELANIPNPRRNEPSEYFLEVALCWIDTARSAAFSDDDNLKSVLIDLQRKATALNRTLEHVHQRFEGTNQRLGNGCYDDDVDDLDLRAMQTLQSHVPPLVNALSLPAADTGTVLRWERCLTEQLMVPAGCGRRRGIKRYPRLDELVWLLERYARTHGGKFTAHRKAGPKGTIVQALDLIRERFLSHPDLQYLADLIPSRDKHPIAAYERILKAARGER